MLAYIPVFPIFVFLCSLFNIVPSAAPQIPLVLEDAGIEPVLEFIDPVFAKTSQKRSFSVIANERYGLVFV